MIKPPAATRAPAMGPLVMREAAAPSEFVEDAALPLAADCPLLLLLLPLLPDVEDEEAPLEDIEPPVLEADEPMPLPLLLSDDRLVAAAWARLL